MADRHRLIGGMLLLTVLGALLMLPPIVYVFNQGLTIFGIPQIVFYLFAMWLALILGTALMAHARPKPTRHGDEPPRGED